MNEESYCGNEHCRRSLNMAGLCAVCDPRGTEKALERLTVAAIRLCNAHRWSYGGVETLEALAEDVARKMRAEG